MKRYDEQRLHDIDTAVTAIRSHLARGELSDGMVFDAVRIRLLEIGEAVKAISPSLLTTERAFRGGTSLRCATSSHSATSTPSTPS